MASKYGPIWSKFKAEGGCGSLKNFGEGKEDFGKDLSAGKAVLYKYCGSSYQNWDKGSSLIFWRWDVPTMAREGIVPYIRI